MGRDRLTEGPNRHATDRKTGLIPLIATIGTVRAWTGKSGPSGKAIESHPGERL
jgi:hypothetical protein